jgi:hypothetical protein
MGGRDEAFRVFDEHFKEITSRWEQDTTTIGRILRAHLFVEHFLKEFLRSRNPQLGSLEDARISFSQTVTLMGNATPGTGYLVPGIRRLNTIRNRLAHTLRAEVTDDDVKAFLAIDMFRAMRDERARRSSTVASTDPIVVLEEFAMHAGISLQASASRNADVWSNAFQAAQEECSDDRAT